MSFCYEYKSEFKYEGLFKILRNPDKIIFTIKNRQELEANMEFKSWNQEFEITETKAKELNMWTETYGTRILKRLNPENPIKSIFCHFT